MKSVFAASKLIRNDSPLRRVILVVDPALSSAAYKTAEGIISYDDTMLLLKCWWNITFMTTYFVISYKISLNI